MNLIPLLGSTFVERKLRGRDRLKGNQLEMFLIRSLLFSALHCSFYLYSPDIMDFICARIYALLLTLFIPFLLPPFLSLKRLHILLEARCYLLFENNSLTKKQNPHSCISLVFIYLADAGRSSLRCFRYSVALQTSNPRHCLNPFVPCLPRRTRKHPHCPSQIYSKCIWTFRR
ncbi:hypothetical protein BS47DRAFT_1487599 [Hydnum rufescens UP504]|uniref:Uncharacterized protein n=1 Tax=Hydnum rufescens UP504 TaxID=1448309 RepID=A0A9P6AQJ2_9AGAM|nr:hypothetical protein BS47DRAFT_1487599 [Hydnum rufescens UP504]